MFQTLKKYIRSVAAVVVVLMATQAGFAGTPQPVSAAVAVMVTLDGGDYISLGDSLFRFNPSAATSLFTASKGHVQACMQANGQGCSLGTAPAPLSLDSATLSKVVQAQSCVLLSGGILASQTVSSSFSIGSGRSRRTYTVQYDIKPTVASVDPFTAWDFVDTPGSGRMKPNARVAVEYVTLDGTTPTYSFPVAINGNWIASISAFTVDGKTSPVYPNLRGNYAGCAVGSSCAWDFDFETTAAMGNVSLIRNGDVRTILNSDATTVNDDGGWNSQYQQEMIVDPAPVSLDPGNHLLALRGRVAGGPSFSVTSNVRMMPASCYSGN